MYHKILALKNKNIIGGSGDPFSNPPSCRSIWSLFPPFTMMVAFRSLQKVDIQLTSVSGIRRSWSLEQRTSLATPLKAPWISNVTRLKTFLSRHACYIFSCKTTKASTVFLHLSPPKWFPSKRRYSSLRWAIFSATRDSIALLNVGRSDIGQ